MKVNSNQCLINLSPIIKLENHISYHFKHKYHFDNNVYNKCVITNLIYNEQSHCVALFKDYLILDDTSEFLKRYYIKKESKKRLLKFYEYYETYSKIFPNYTSLPEGKYFYFNIQKKQKMIDLQEQMEFAHNLQTKKNSIEEKSDEVFSTDVYDSIINERNNEDLEEVFNLNEKEDEFIDKIKELISDINKNDNANISPNQFDHHYKRNRITNTNNIPLQLTSNLFSEKHKLLISSLLGRNKYISTKIDLNNNSNDTYNKVFFNINNQNISTRNNNNNNNSHSSYKLINSQQIPFANPSTSRNYNHNINTINNCNNNNTQTNCNNIQETFMRNSANRTKLLSDYQKTIEINNYTFIQKKYKNKIGVKSLLSQRNFHRNKSNESNINKDINNKHNNFMEIEKDTEKNKQINRKHKMPIKTPPKCTNNYIYIINHNPKFTTHVSYFNNNNTTATALSSSHSIKNKNQGNNVIDNSQPYKIASNRCSVDNVNVYSVSKSKGKTRNSKQTIINNNMILKTTRDLHNKDSIFIRASSQPSIQMNKANNNCNVAKYNWRRNLCQFRQTSNNQTNTLSNNQQGNNNELIIKTNKAKINNINTHSNNRNTNTNLNGNTNKLFSSQQVVKGIQIKNFNKVFTKTLSKAISDRLRNNNKNKNEY